MLKPPQVTDFKSNLRRFTRECRPAGGKAKDEWCTQEVWRVTVDYSFGSDVDPNARSERKNVKSGTIACKCDCVKVVGQACVSGKGIYSSGLQGESGNYYTDYTVQYKATIGRKKWKSWTQGVRSKGGRSWYGYSYSAMAVSNSPRGV